LLPSKKKEKRRIIAYENKKTTKNKK